MKPMVLGTLFAVGLIATVDSTMGADLDWPMYRHDLQLTSFSAGQGRITKPSLLWEYYLGAPEVTLASHSPASSGNEADLDGDGVPERYTVTDRTITTTNLAGEVLWTHTVDGLALGTNVRVAKLLPDRPGLQIVTFSNRMDTGEGQGYCFAFDRGADHGELVWTTGPLTGQHAPTIVVDDVDADGKLDIVLAPHYRVMIFNGQTGQLKAEVPWSVGRNYGVLVAQNVNETPEKEIFIVCDFVLHVDGIQFSDGAWHHAWGHKYFDPNQPQPQGREKYIHVGPNPIVDINGDGRFEMVYMLIDAALDDQWHLRVRDAMTGEVQADVAGVWVWSLLDMNGDGVTEVLYTPTSAKRPATFCEIRCADLRDGNLVDQGRLAGVRPLLTHADFPTHVHSIADGGLTEILRADVDRDGTNELFFLQTSDLGERIADTVIGIRLTEKGLESAWEWQRPGHRLNVTHVGPNDDGDFVLRLRDLTNGRALILDANETVVADEDLRQPSGFVTTPIAADLNGDGTNEIIVQTAAREIVALQFGDEDPLWTVPGVAMNHSPGYAWNGALCPQAADLAGDGKPVVVFAAEDDKGLGSLVCVDGAGRQRWRTSFPGCAWGGLEAGVNLWSFGRFTGRKNCLDVYVDVHRRSKGSSEGWALRGDTGEVLWHQKGLVATETAMPFGGGLPAVFDFDRNGIDDLVQEFYTIFGVLAGDSGRPLYPPAYLPGKDFFGRWIAYSSPTVADLNGDGAAEVYLNSASYARGGYATCHANGRPLWVEFHSNTEGSNGFGPVGDFNRDGSVEIGVPVLNNTLLLLAGNDGAHLWKANVPVAGDVIGADIDGDGVAELIFAGKDGHLHALSGVDGAEEWRFPVTGRPIAADVNGDGFLEIVLVGNDGVLRVVGATEEE